MVVRFALRSQPAAKLRSGGLAMRPLLVGLVAASLVVAQAGLATANEPLRSQAGSSPGESVEVPGQPPADAIETDGVPLVLAIVAAVIAGGGFADQMGRNAGARVYYAGVTMAQYQHVKWETRAAVIAGLGVILRPIFMSSFESTFSGLAT